MNIIYKIWIIILTYKTSKYEIGLNGKFSIDYIKIKCTR